MRTRSITIKVYGKWFYQTNGIPVKDHAPVKGWTQEAVIPGKFTGITDQDRNQAKHLHADVILLGTGETMQVYRVE